MISFEGFGGKFECRGFGVWGGGLPRAGQGRRRRRRRGGQLQRILAVLGLHKRVRKGLGGSGHADDTKLLVELRVKRTQN